MFKLTVNVLSVFVPIGFCLTNFHSFVSWLKYSLSFGDSVTVKVPVLSTSLGKSPVESVPTIRENLGVGSAIAVASIFR